ncbi:MAG: WD40 repeat domain-containing protein, partial [Chloroflexota bacterium]
MTTEQPDQPSNTSSVGIGNIGGSITDSIIAGRDVHQQITNNITRIKERALTAAEEAKTADSIAQQQLAEAVNTYVTNIGEVATDDQDALQGGPYRGLKTYTLQEAEIFFGRDETLSNLLAQLHQGALTILHAESGAGKSSLLQAGLQHQLIIQGHVPLYIRPYDQSPTMTIKKMVMRNVNSYAEASLLDFLHQVTAVLGRETILVILIDQFEELFFNLNKEARQVFVAELAECLENETLNVRWVLSLRTEFFGNLANFRPRIRNPFENDFRLNRLPREQARMVITVPAERFNIRYEPALVDALLDDLHDPDNNEVAPAQLQLVCLALYDLLRTQQQTNADVAATITMAMYEKEGRTEGILRGHLNRVLRNRVGRQDRELARQLLIALVSSDQRRIRRTKSELAATLSTYLTAAQSLDDILDQLVDSRLLNIDEDKQTDEFSYELAHDLLLKQIELDPDTQTRKAAEELLKQEVDAFTRHNTLLSKDKFDIINSQRQFLTLDETSEALLAQSEAVFEQEAREKARRQRRTLMIAAVVIVVLLGLSVFAIILSARATASAEEARNAEAAAEVERQNAEQSAQQALTAEAEAVRSAAGARQSEATATRALATAERAESDALAKGTEVALQAETAQAGQAAAQTAEAKAGKQADIAQTAEAQAQAQANIAATRAAEAEQAQAQAEHQSQIALAQSLAALAPRIYNDHELTTLLSLEAYSLNQQAKGEGLWLIDENFRQVLNQPSFSRILSGHQAWVRSVAFSSDRHMLASGDSEGTILLWDLSDVSVAPRVLRGHDERVSSVAFSPDGETLASGSADATVRLWDLSDVNANPIVLRGHDERVSSVAFSPDGETLASGSWDNTVRLWDLNDTSAPPLTLSGHEGNVESVAFSPDGETVA